MTLDRARELIKVQLQFGGGYNRNAVRSSRRDPARPRPRGRRRPDRELDLEQRFGLAPGRTLAGDRLNNPLP